MFRAISRLFRAIGHYLSFGFISAAESIENDPGVISMQYEDVIRDKKNRLARLMDAVAGVAAQKESHRMTLERLTTEIEELEEEMNGALVMLNERAQILKKQNMTIEEIESDLKYREVAAAYQDLDSTLEEKRKRTDDLEADITRTDEVLGGYRIDLMDLQRELQKLKQEKHEAVADIISAREIADVNKVLAGIGEDRTSEQLSRLRDRRAQSVARRNVAQDLAGTSANRQRAELRTAAHRAATMNKLRGLVGLAEEAKPSAEAPESEKPEGNLPE